jgi:L-ectoine synthase
VEKSLNFVEWGAGTSHRLVTKHDNMGFSICHTIVFPNTESMLEYKNYLEACYCIYGCGEIENMNGKVYKIEVGTIYILDNNDKHKLRNVSCDNLILVSVFNPSLNGDEIHTLDEIFPSSY